MRVPSGDHLGERTKLPVTRDWKPEPSALMIASASRFANASCVPSGDQPGSVPNVLISASLPPSVLIQIDPDSMVLDATRLPSGDHAGKPFAKKKSVTSPVSGSNLQE